MKGTLLYDVIRFIFEKKTVKGFARRLVLSIAFYPFLSRSISSEEKINDEISSGQMGDDVYPLF